MQKWQDLTKAKIDKNAMLQEKILFINLDKKLKIGKIQIWYRRSKLLKAKASKFNDQQDSYQNYHKDDS